LLDLDRLAGVEPRQPVTRRQLAFVRRQTDDDLAIALGHEMTPSERLPAVLVSFPDLPPFGQLKVRDAGGTIDESTSQAGGSNDGDS
jgi:hypothetical protein